LLSPESDYVKGSGKQITLEELKVDPLYVDIRDVDITGGFKLKFSEPVFMIKP
jgi:hypothetical protein